MDVVYHCCICSENACGPMNFKTLARHGRVHHEEAYYANLGPGDKYYAIPSTSCRFCSSCAVYIGHHSLEDHALNARHIEGISCVAGDPIPLVCDARIIDAERHRKGDHEEYW